MAVDNSDQEIHDVLDLSQALATANNKQLVETIARLWNMKGLGGGSLACVQKFIEQEIKFSRHSVAHAGTD